MIECYFPVFGCRNLKCPELQRFTESRNLPAAPFGIGECKPFFSNGLRQTAKQCSTLVSDHRNPRYSIDLLGGSRADMISTMCLAVCVLLTPTPMPILTLTLQIERGERLASVSSTALLDALATPLDTRAAAACLVDDVLSQLTIRATCGECCVPMRPQPNPAT